LSRLIYVDAFVPNNEESALDLLPETIQKSLQEDAYANGTGPLLCASILAAVNRAAGFSPCCQ
jgi:hypothetical protein